MRYHRIKRQRQESANPKPFVQRLLLPRHTVSIDEITRALDPDLFRKTYRLSEAAFALLLSEVQDLVEKPLKDA